MFWLYALILPALCELAHAGPQRRGSAWGVKRELRQTTRADVVRRASSVRPKRATVSGNSIPSTSNPQTFIMQASGTGTSADGQYAEASYSFFPYSSYPFYAAFDVSSPTDANLYMLNTAGNLIRFSDGLTAYAGDSSTYSSPQAFSFISFLTPADAANYGSFPIVCTIDPLKTMSCFLDNPSDLTAATQNQLTVSLQYNNILGIGVPGADSGQGNVAVTITAIDAY